MKAEVITKRFIRCPSCKACTFEAEHLYKDRRSFGPWSCSSDTCDAVISGRIHEDESIEITVVPREGHRTLVLLRLGHLFFVLNQKYGPITNPDFFYHSHQCPTNLLSKVEEVFDPAHGKDPHGQMRYVATIADTQETRDALDECSTLEGLLRMFKTDGTPAESEWPVADAGVLPMIAQWQREAASKGDA